jgi:hypothetical protein
MLTYISLLVAFGSWYSQLYEPVPLRDSYMTLQDNRAQLEGFVKQLEEMLATTEIVKLSSEARLCDNLIRCYEALAESYKKERNDTEVKRNEGNIKAIKSMKEILAEAKDKPSPDQLAQLERVRKQIRSRPSSAQTSMPETLMPLLRFLQRVDDQLRREQARHTL